MISNELFRRYYPDESRNGTRAFYDWLRHGVSIEKTVLNIGAGPETRNATRILRGEARRVIGIDIDPIVLSNSELDEARLIENDRFPCATASVDLAYADYVLEHVKDSTQFMREVHRVLVPGGAFYFRTPNKWHYVSLISSLTPHAFHKLVANPVRGLPRDTHEPWPTHYSMNTTATLRSLASQVGFASTEIRHFEPNPSYLVFGSVPFLLGVAYERLVNQFGVLRFLRANIFGKFIK